MKIYRCLCLVALLAMVAPISSPYSADSVGEDIVNSMREAREMEEQEEPSARDVYMRENYPLPEHPIYRAQHLGIPDGDVVWELKEREPELVDSKLAGEE